MLKSRVHFPVIRCLKSPVKPSIDNRKVNQTTQPGLSAAVKRNFRAPFMQYYDTKMQQYCSAAAKGPVPTTRLTLCDCYSAEVHCTSVQYHIIPEQLCISGNLTLATIML